MTTSSLPRVPAGTPSGGQFATPTHPEADLRLDPLTEDEPLDLEWEETLPADPQNPAIPDVSDPMNDPYAEWVVCCATPQVAAARLCGCGGTPYP